MTTLNLKIKPITQETGDNIHRLFQIQLSIYRFDERRLKKKKKKKKKRWRKRRGIRRRGKASEYKEVDRRKERKVLGCVFPCSPATVRLYTFACRPPVPSVCCVSLGQPVAFLFHSPSLFPLSVSVCLSVCHPSRSATFCRFICHSTRV